MTEPNQPDVVWKSLPPVEGGVWVAMITDILDQHDIPNMVKTDLEAGGVGMITGTVNLGRATRIQVPVNEYERALELFQGVMGGEVAEDEDDPQRA